MPSLVPEEPPEHAVIKIKIKAFKNLNLFFDMIKKISEPNLDIIISIVHHM